MYNEAERTAKNRVNAGEHVIYISVPYYNNSDGSLGGIRVIAIGNQGYFSDICFDNDIDMEAGVPGSWCGV
ncbi:hypothetical protein [Glycomyces terrestris]|uniref:Uncharacterized protein n=1 Tax=Glycomyces terrestris TaxID=2493553 RepID=A0A426V0R1_9ACTN|nr:hypothetical protein [Glycomyces terrestris]RRS00417.1 hypothetical protein EIW28_07570 [Glycomyces terrestris]